MKKRDVDYLWWDGFMRGLPLDQARRFSVAGSPASAWFYNWSKRLGIRVARLTVGREIVLIRIR